MFSRYFLSFCVVLLVVAVVSISAESVEEVDDVESSVESVEARGLGKKVRKILKKVFKHATEDCLKKAVKKCKKHWYNPSKVISCAKDFLSIENAACLVGA